MYRRRIGVSTDEVQGIARILVDPTQLQATQSQLANPCKSVENVDPGQVKEGEHMARKIEWLSGTRLFLVASKWRRKKMFLDFYRLSLGSTPEPVRVPK